jgi:hypothetical protein
MTQQLVVRKILQSVITAGFTALLGSPSANAGFYRYPLQGYHKACADGSTVDIAVFPGVGYMHLSGSGNMMNAYPLNTLGWTPSLGGSSLCWTRQMSAESQESMSRSFYIYCVQQRRSYCIYD